VKNWQALPLQELCSSRIVTKYSRNLFTREMLDNTKEVIKETCEKMECELLEFGGEPDHVHLMMSVHPKVAVSNLVGNLKGSFLT
jgi:putative transposase